MTAIDPRPEEYETPDELVVTLPAVEASVPRARHAIAGACRELGADETVCARIAIATSEAVTNTILHAFPDGEGEVSASARREGDELKVIVADDGRGLAPRSDSPGMGLGLGIIAEVTDRLSIVADGRRGTEVHMWFAVAG